MHAKEESQSTFNLSVWALNYCKSIMGMSQKVEFSKTGYLSSFVFYYFVKNFGHTEKLN